MNKSISRAWTFASDSNATVEYESLQYMDGTTSCSCKGWTRRVAPDGSRSCKHTRYVDMGTADHHCKVTHNCETQNKNTSHPKHQILQFPKLGPPTFPLYCYDT